MTWPLRSSRTPVILTAGVLFVVVSVLPVVYMLSSAIVNPAALRAALLDGRQAGLLSNTLMLGIGTAVLATAIGAPFGFTFARIALPFKSGLRLALAAPAVLPPYVVAMALAYAGGDRASTLGGAILALSVVLYPLSMLAVEVAVRRVEPRLEEAAHLVAPPHRVLREITWPLVAPSVMAASLVIFVLAISDFSVPGLLRVRVFTTEVFSALAALYDVGRATALAIPLLMVAVAVAGFTGTRVGGRVIATRRSVLGTPPDAGESFRSVAIVMVAAVIALTLVTPATVLVREALRVTSLAAVVRDSRAAVINSLVLAAIGATTITLVAACLGYARARATPGRGRVFDTLCVALFAVPSTVVGIGMIAMWNRADIFGALYGTSVMLVLGYAARFLPVAALVIAATVRSIPDSQEEAAAVAGAGWLRSMIRIVVPQMRAALMAVWVIAFVLAFGEVGTSILVAPPGESTLPIRVYTMTANAPPGHVAALALFQSVIILSPLTILGAWLATRDRA